MRSQGGFTLLEVLVATTIMGVAVVTLMSGLSGSARNTMRLTDYDRVALVARAKMDALLVDPKLPQQIVIDEPLDPVLLGGAKGGSRTRVTPFEARQGAGPGTPSLDRVQLEIWWMAGDQRRSFTLEGYRRGIVHP